MAKSEYVFVLFSYCRPNLTQAAIERILKWNSSATILLSIDGLRAQASDEEFVLWKRTRRIGIEFSEKFRNVKLFLWEENKGLTNHAKRIFSIAVEISELVISLEEDLDITNEGFEFLTCSPQGRNIARSAYTSTNHFSYVNTKLMQTFFPQQWATAYTDKILVEFLSFNYTSKVKRSVIWMATQNVRGLLRRILLTEHWYEHIKNCLAHPSYGDALVQYCVWKMNLSFVIPTQSFVTDIAHIESGGLNPRANTQIATNHFLSPGQNDLIFCEECERNRSQISANIFRSILGSKKHHFISRLRSRIDTQSNHKKG